MAGESPPDEKESVRFGYTGAGYWGGAWYPYWSLMLITVLGGFFGLDHFWLRSPLSGVLKCLVNIFSLGVWYIYDILQIFGYKDIVLKSGLSVPLFGAQGIGAGVFKDLPGVEGEAKAPWRWLGYLLMCFMPFGIDSFMGGDTKGGLVKFIYTIIPIMWPLLFLWKCVDVYRAFITPKSVWEDGMLRFFPANVILPKYYPTTLGPSDPIEADSNKYGVVGMVLQPVVDTVIGPAKAISGAVSAMAGTAEAVADGATEIVHAATDSTLPVVSLASSVLQKAPDALNVIPDVLQGSTSKLVGLTNPSGLKALAAKQVPGLVAKGMSGGGIGGGGLDAWAVGGVSLLILVGGVFLGALRVKEIVGQNNGSSSKDDKPPKPFPV
jgi:hypothetical protein